jgi:AcrR family transcriptional regulator
VTSAKPDIEGEHGAGARERILRTAYELFCRHGVTAVGVERIIAEAGVHRSSLYKHFASKEELALAVLAHRDEVWTERWLRGVVADGTTPADRMLAIFDAFDGWFRREGYEGCLFINSLLESRDSRTPVGAASVAGLRRLRELLRELAEEHGAPDPARLAIQLQILLAGSIVQAATGVVDAASLARPVAAALIAEAGAG